MQNENLNIVDPKKIASVVREACSDCYGIVGMASPNGITLLTNILPPILNRQGVEVLCTNKGYKINIYIVAEYGTSFEAIATSLIDTVKYYLYNSLGVKTAGIRVHIKGVRKSEI